MTGDVRQLAARYAGSARSQEQLREVSRARRVSRWVASPLRLAVPSRRSRRSRLAQVWRTLGFAEPRGWPVFCEALYGFEAETYGLPGFPLGDQFAENRPRLQVGVVAPLALAARPTVELAGI